jgi:hypothetical protein
MARRLVALQGREWVVHPAAERQSTTADWQLIFGFRPRVANRAFRTIWAAHAFTARTKAGLLRRADLVTDHELVALLESAKPGDGG